MTTVANAPFSTEQNPGISIPTDLHHTLDSIGWTQQPILYASTSDTDMSGRPAAPWLVVTADHVSVIASGDSPSLLVSVAIQDIESFRTWAAVGSGTLQAKTQDGHWIDLLRFSNALADRFHKIARKLQGLRDDGQFVLAQDEPLEAPRCPKCQLRLGHVQENCPRCIPRGQILARVGELMHPYWRGSVVLCLLTLVGVAAELVPPKLQQYLVDDVLAGQTNLAAKDSFLTALLCVVLALAASRVVLSLVGVFKGKLATTIGAGLTSRLRSQLVRKLQKLAVAYYDRHQVGSLLGRVAYDTEVLHGLVHQITGGFLLQIVQLIAVGAMLLWLNTKLALFTLIPVPLVIGGTWFFWNRVYPRYYKLWDSSSKQMAALSGMLSGIRVVKAFAQENREYERFEKSSDYLRASRLWVENSTAWYSGGMQLVFSLGGLIVWYVGGRDVLGDDMTLGQLIAFLAYLGMFYAPLGALSSFTTWLTSFLSGSKRVLELLDTPLTIAEPEKPREWSNVKGSIEFDHVTFGYERHQPVIKDVSFSIQPGEMIGIVGRSGSGKTTMVNLLGRFYDVQEGRILIDGMDVRELSMQDLRSRLGIVFQESFLFRGTIWDNLSYGRPNTQLEEGLVAAKAAGAHDFICRTSFGYQTPLGEQGSGLSGGEKQRLSIARTLLYDPRILVLDEATSNIDAEAEKSIQEALEVLIRGRTTVAIAHRLSTLRNADRIFVFDRGRLVESGSHAQLLRDDGVYAKLVKIQTQISKDPNVDTLVTHTQPTSDEPIANSESASSKDNESTSISLVDQAVPPKHSLRWLEPELHHFAMTQSGQIEFVETNPEERKQAMFVVRCFPAAHPEGYLSVRGWNDEGDEVEIGMIRSLSSWSEREQECVRESLRRRYLIRTIQRVFDVKLHQGYLDIDVETDVGRQSFVMRWSHSQAQDYGLDGKLLIDSEDNRFVVPSMEGLPKQDRRALEQYIYW